MESSRAMDKLNFQALLRAIRTERCISQTSGVALPLWWVTVDIGETWPSLYSGNSCGQLVETCLGKTGKGRTGV